MRFDPQTNGYVVYQREVWPRSPACDERSLASFLPSWSRNVECTPRAQRRDRAGVPETAHGVHSAKAPSTEPGARQLAPIVGWRAAQRCR